MLPGIRTCVLMFRSLCFCFLLSIDSANRLTNENPIESFFLCIALCKSVAFVVCISPLLLCSPPREGVVFVGVLLSRSCTGNAYLRVQDTAETQLRESSPATKEKLLKIPTPRPTPVRPLRSSSAACFLRRLIVGSSKASFALSMQQCSSSVDSGVVSFPVSSSGTEF